MTTATNPVARQVLAAVKYLELPAALAKRLDAIARAEDASLDYTAGQLAAVVSTALLDGRDPGTDDTVTEALRRHQIGSLPAQVIPNHLAELRLSAIANHAGALFDQIIAKVNAAGEVIAQAQETIGQNDIDKVDARRLNTEQFTRWQEARRALPAIHTGMVTWITLTRELHLAPSIDRQPRRALIVADLSADEIDDVLRQPDGKLSKQPSKADENDVIKAGMRIDMADPDEYATRCRQEGTQRNRRPTPSQAAEAERKRNRVPFAV